MSALLDGTLAPLPDTHVFLRRMLIQQASLGFCLQGDLRHSETFSCKPQISAVRPDSYFLFIREEIKAQGSREMCPRLYG